MSVTPNFHRLRLLKRYAASFAVVAAFSGLVYGGVQISESSSASHRHEAIQIVRGACGAKTAGRFAAAYGTSYKMYEAADKWAAECANGL